MDISFRFEGEIILRAYSPHSGRALRLLGPSHRVRLKVCRGAIHFADAHENLLRGMKALNMSNLYWICAFILRQLIEPKTARFRNRYKFQGKNP